MPNQNREVNDAFEMTVWRWHDKERTMVHDGTTMRDNDGYMLLILAVTACQVKMHNESCCLPNVLNPVLTSMQLFKAWHQPQDNTELNIKHSAWRLVVNADYRHLVPGESHLVDVESFQSGKRSSTEERAIGEGQVLVLAACVGSGHCTDASTCRQHTSAQVMWAEGAAM